MINKNKDRGITLVALVITIIILLILATISIQSLTNTGLFAKAQEAKEKTKNATENQAKTLNEYEDELNKYISGDIKTPVKKVADNIGKVLSNSENTELQDEKGNKIVVPAGFKIVSDDTTNNAQTVDKGIVIEDATETATKGSQFVWVPVGIITREDGSTTTINLNRYTFADDGNPTAQSDAIIEKYYQELEISDKGNAVAKSIKDFKKSAETKRGYYIGRYEARKNSNGTITEVKTDTVWNNITQPDAATKSQNMYNSNKFASDLINSYAWDTATFFLQTCGNNSIPYSIQTSLNKDSLANEGTNAAEYIGTRDNVCNVYDMASNLSEWTTETSSNLNYPCVRRGGIYTHTYDYTNVHMYDVNSNGYINVGFRVLIYMQ